MMRPRSSHRLDEDDPHVLPMYPVYLSPIFSVGQFLIPKVLWRSPGFAGEAGRV
jgi:hypothetical protein